MASFDRFMESVLGMSKSMSLSKIKGLLNLFEKCSLIAFSRVSQMKACYTNNAEDVKRLGSKSLRRERVHEEYLL